MNRKFVNKIFAFLSLLMIAGFSQNVFSQTLVSYPDTFNVVYKETTTAVTVISNDLYNGAAATSATVTASVTIAPPAGLTLNPNGTITVASTVNPGTYTINYRICAVSAPAICSGATTATVKILSYNGNVGINTVNPTANLHVKGTLRLQNGSEKDGAVMQVYKDGSMHWQKFPKPTPITGVFLTSEGVNLNGTSGTAIYAKAYIDLPYGKWIVRNRTLLARSDNDINWTGGGTAPDTGGAFWVTSYLSDSDTVSTPTADVPATQSKQMSGNVLMPSFYGNLGGGIIIHNQSTAGSTKRYYFWVKATRYNSANGQVVGLYGSRWGENFIMAIPLY